MEDKKHDKENSNDPILINNDIQNSIMKKESIKSPQNLTSLSLQKSLLKDPQGDVYYHDRFGDPYYIDKNGKPYWKDSNLNKFRKDMYGERIYLDQYNRNYVVVNEKVVYLNENGERILLMQPPNPYQEINGLRFEMRDLKERFSFDLGQAQKEIGSLHKELKLKDTEIIGLNKEIISLLEKNRGLRNEINDFISKGRQESNEQLKDLQFSGTKTSEEINDLKYQLGLANERILFLTGKEKHTEKKFAEALKQANRFCTEIEKEREAIRAYKSEIDICKQQVDNRDDQIKSLCFNLKDTQEKYNSMVSSNYSHMNKISECEKKCKNTEEELSRFSLSMLDLEFNLNTKEKELVSVKDDLKKTLEEKKVSDENLIKKTEEIIQLKKEVEETIKQKKVVESNLVNKEKEIIQIKKEVEEANNQKKVVESNLVNKEKEVIQLKKEVEETIKQKKVVEGNLINKVKGNIQLEKEVEETVKQKKVIESNLVNKEKEVIQLKKEVEETIKQKKVVEGNLINKMKEVIQLKKDVEETNNQKKVIESNLVNKEKEVIQLKKEVEETINQKKVVEGNLVNKEKEIIQLKKEVEKALKKNKNLHSAQVRTHREFKESKEQLKESKEQIKKIQGENDKSLSDWRHSIFDLTGKLTTVTDQKSTIEKKLVEKEKQVDECNIKIKKLGSELETVNNSLKSLKEKDEKNMNISKQTNEKVEDLQKRLDLTIQIFKDYDKTISELEKQQGITNTTDTSLNVKQGPVYRESLVTEDSQGLSNEYNQKVVKENKELREYLIILEDKLEITQKIVDKLGKEYKKCSRDLSGSLKAYKNLERVVEKSKECVHEFTQRLQEAEFQIQYHEKLLSFQLKKKETKETRDDMYDHSRTFHQILQQQDCSDSTISDEEDNEGKTKKPDDNEIEIVKSLLELGAEVNTGSRIVDMISTLENKIDDKCVYIGKEIFNEPRSTLKRKIDYEVKENVFVQKKHPKHQDSLRSKFLLEKITDRSLEVTRVDYNTFKKYAKILCDNRVNQVPGGEIVSKNDVIHFEKALNIFGSTSNDPLPFFFLSKRYNTTMVNVCFSTHLMYNGKSKNASPVFAVLQRFGFYSCKNRRIKFKKCKELDCLEEEEPRVEVIGDVNTSKKKTRFSLWSFDAEELIKKK